MDTRFCRACTTSLSFAHANQPRLPASLVCFGIQASKIRSFKQFRNSYSVGTTKSAVKLLGFHKGPARSIYDAHMAAFAVINHQVMGSGSISFMDATWRTYCTLQTLLRKANSLVPRNSGQCMRTLHALKIQTHVHQMIFMCRTMASLPSRNGKRNSK